MKKYYIVFFLVLEYSNTISQDVINSYLDYSWQPSGNLNITSTPSLYYINESTETYNGEYEILLDESNPWGNQFCGGISNAPFDFSKFALSYKIELVSFPFSTECAFPSSANPSGGCNQPSERILNVADDLLYNQVNKWEYEPSNVLEYSLWRITEERLFNRNSTFVKAFSDQSNPNTLVSSAFVKTTGTAAGRYVLPHSILKHTVFLRCGNLINSPILSSFTWYSDLTRGRMREYPFYFGAGSANLQSWDIITRPEIFNFGIYSSTDNSNCCFNRPLIGANCNGASNFEGYNINYTPFDPTFDDFCAFVPNISNPYNSEYFSNSSTYNQIGGLLLSDYTVIASTSPRNFNGTTLAGYVLNNNDELEPIDPNPPLFQKYYIDKNITINNINNIERTIFNPSEAYITANNLKFPTNYTFKTIRGIYPYASEVKAAEDDVYNGGPFTDPTKGDVPVETDLYKDFHITNPIYPSNDHRYASIYHLMTGSKLTIEPCVKIFDATFEINPGSEMIFENWATNLINVNRYLLLLNGGIVTRQNDYFLFENKSISDRILKWKSATHITAGDNVDPATTNGEYSIEPNAHVEFIANNYIELESGFIAKEGSEFEAAIAPVVIPACGPLRLKNPRQISSTENGNSSDIGYFTISPNPTNEYSYFMFELFGRTNSQILVYDAMGKLIKRVGENSLLPTGKYSYKLESADLASGIYFAKLITNNSEKSLKFVKQ